MPDNETWMRRALELARLGAGAVAPNPMVGAVLVEDGRILAEGWHAQVGGPHAEVACLNAFGPDPIPANAVLYVTLEPCSHHGRTPPCVDLIIARGVKNVVVAHHDPFTKVNDSGVQQLRDAGISVIEGVCEAEARWTNRRFLTSIEEQRPYVIMKWAVTADGLLDQHPRKERVVQRISSPETDLCVHRWRSEEQAILIGSRTAVNDDPALTVRHVVGRDPLRVVLDRSGAIPSDSKVFDGSAPTLLFTGDLRAMDGVEEVHVANGTDPIQFILEKLNERSIRSLIVEGGAELLQHFIRQDLWDEARVIRSTALFGKGTPAPELDGTPVRIDRAGVDMIQFYFNGHDPEARWPL